MTSVLNSALAGMNRDLRGIATAAGNIANVNTDGYRTRREDSAAGVTTPRVSNSGDADAAALLDSTSSDVDFPTSDVDLATEFVHLELHEISYQANGLLIKVADRLMKETLDLLA